MEPVGEGAVDDVGGDVEGGRVGDARLYEVRDGVFVDIDHVVVDLDVKGVVIDGVFPDGLEAKMLQMKCLV